MNRRQAGVFEANLSEAFTMYLCERCEQTSHDISLKSAERDLYWKCRDEENKDKYYNVKHFARWNIKRNANMLWTQWWKQGYGLVVFIYNEVEFKSEHSSLIVVILYCLEH